MNLWLSFRDAAQRRTRNLEIPGLRHEAHPGMTKSHEVLLT
jgi:hypothetical protein